MSALPRARAVPDAGECLVVDPIKCTGHGMCAELCPEWITLDDWGYPIIDPTEIPPSLEGHARRAANACPTLALILRRAE